MFMSEFLYLTLAGQVGIRREDYIGVE